MTTGRNVLTTLYRTDFFHWTRDQARRLRREARRGARSDLDFEHLAEEIEGLGIENRRELLTRISRVMEQLLKLERAKTEEERREALARITRQRSEIREILEESPSLWNVAERRLPSSYARARRQVMLAIEGCPETVPPPETCPFSLEQVSDPEWWPEEVRR